MAVELPELLLPHAAAWRDWLAEHHASSPGVRLVLHKAGGAVTELTYALALDEALCVGWIDGQLGRRDEGSFRQRFTPRRPRSPWSVRNTEHVSRLLEQGRMLPAGQAAVDGAKVDGRWEAAYAGSATITVPDDLAQAVAADPAAQAMWDVLSSTNRYAFLWRLTQVKRAETRARNIAGFVAMLGRGETFHPQKARSPLD